MSFQTKPKSNAASPRAGLRPAIFSTPRSPSSASVARLGRASEDSSSKHSGSRKRARTGGEESTSARLAPTNPRQRWSLHSRNSQSASPPPLSNTKYLLAGELDTPTAAATSSLANFDYHSRAGSDSDFRRRWTREVNADGRRTFSLEGLERERNGKARPSCSMEQTESWAQYMFRIAGGLAGRVWDFCNPNAFQGFTSGGGTGYVMTEGAPYKLDHNTPRTPTAVYPVLPRHDDDMRSTPIPGEFPMDDYVQVSEQPSEDEYTRPPKRLQTTQGAEWVVVNSSRPAPREIRVSPRPYSSASPYRSSRVPRPAHPRVSSGRRPRPSAGGRASGIPNSSASVAGVSLTDLNSATSFASQRYLAASPHEKPVKPSPSPKDIQRYSARKERQERQNDASLQRLNSQLKAMIQEGQQALASKIEINEYDPFVDEPEDEGFSEGDFSHYMKT